MTRGDLHRYNCILSNFCEDIKFISHKYEKADHPKRFINSVRQFQDRSSQCHIDHFDYHIIPLNYFDIPKSFILIKLPLSLFYLRLFSSSY